jgi:transcription antitermination factor NusG
MSDAEDSEDTLLTRHDGRSWCALHTRARHEKKVAAACVRLKIPSYLPLRISRTFSGGKINTFNVPMFGGYVFAALRPGEISELKRTGSVAQRIDTDDEGGLLRDLAGVRRVEVARLELDLSPTFRRGQKVMVTEGPLSGVVGVVVRYKNKRRLQVAIEAIHQAILVEVPAEALAPVST